MEEPVRLNKFIASCGICSRRDADKLIEEGRVTVNGMTALQGQKVTGSDEISVNGKKLKGPDSKVVLAFYKPKGITCTERDPHAEKVVNDIIRYPVRLTYAGRLDKDSEGLLLLTNDGDLIEKMMRGSNGHEKEYVVSVNKKIFDIIPKKFEKGMYLKDLDRTTLPAKVNVISDRTFSVVLTQGLNRQIRRMCEACGYRVDSLKRIRVANVTLGELKPGEYREITGDELTALYDLVK